MLSQNMNSVCNSYLWDRDNTHFDNRTRVDEGNEYGFSDRMIKVISVCIKFLPILLA